LKSGCTKPRCNGGVATHEHVPDGDTYFRRCLAFANRGEHDQAIANFDEALAPHCAESDNRGMAHAERDEHHDAIADCTETLRLTPEAVDAFDSRGVAHCMTEDYNQALAGGTAAITVSSLAAGLHTVDAAYSGHGRRSLAKWRCRRELRIGLLVRGRAGQTWGRVLAGRRPFSAL
jgi:hypothetical protein